jgi:hypothetical protein
MALMKTLMMIVMPLKELQMIVVKLMESLIKTLTDSKRVG